MGGPEEVATAVASCWADARYITGGNIAVDGGVRGSFVPRVIGICRAIGSALRKTRQRVERRLAALLDVRVGERLCESLDAAFDGLQ